MERATYEWSQVENTRGQTMHRLTLAMGRQTLYTARDTRFEALHAMRELLDKYPVYSEVEQAALLVALNEAETEKEGMN